MQSWPTTLKGASDDEKEISHPSWDRTEDFCDMLPVCNLWRRLGHLKASLLSCQRRRGQRTQQSTLGPHAVTDPVPKATAAGALSSLFSRVHMPPPDPQGRPIAPRKQTVLQRFPAPRRHVFPLPCHWLPTLPPAAGPLTSVHPCRRVPGPCPVASSPPGLTTLTLTVEWVCTPGLESWGSESFFPLCSSDAGAPSCPGRSSSQQPRGCVLPAGLVPSTVPGGLPALPVPTAAVTDPSPTAVKTLHIIKGIT